LQVQQNSISENYILESVKFRSKIFFRKSIFNLPQSDREDYIFSYVVSQIILSIQLNVIYVQLTSSISTNSFRRADNCSSAPDDAAFYKTIYNILQALREKVKLPEIIYLLI
jgi:hypothetical protein